MRWVDYSINIVLSVFLIFGVYQFYFFTQRHCRRPISLWTPLDDIIPFRPAWVWIYSGLYYPIIVYVNLAMMSAHQFTHVAMSYIVLLFLQMLCFLALPVATPDAWRRFDRRASLSHRFLALVHHFDETSNCFPSMHTSVAVLTGFHLVATIGAWAWVFPIIISISCLFTKQHFLADLPAGAAVGWAAYQISLHGFGVHALY